MRIAAIACAALIGLAGGTAWAGCDWHTAKTSDTVASTGTSTPAPTPPVVLPETDSQG